MNGRWGRMGAGALLVGCLWTAAAAQPAPGLDERTKYDMVENELGRRTKKYAMIAGGIVLVFVGYKVFRRMSGS